MIIKKMIEFAGKYNAIIDDKGRIVLPSALKKEMGEFALEPLVLEMSLHKECLDIHPNKYWQERVLLKSATRSCQYLLG